jgi:hypothetical protein
MMRVLKKGGSIYLIENSSLGAFETIRGKHLLPENPTLVYKKRLEQTYGFSLMKEIATYFNFDSLKQAKEVFTAIYGETIAKNIKSKKIEHKVLILKREKTL